MSSIRAGALTVLLYVGVYAAVATFFVTMGLLLR